MQNDVRAALEFRLGDDSHDFTGVNAGEERFFVPIHLKIGSMPALRVIADPSIYATADESFSCGVQVSGLGSIPAEDRWDVISYSGSVRDDNSGTYDMMAFSVPEAGTYDLHYAFADSLRVTLSVYSDTGHYNEPGPHQGFEQQCPVPLAPGGGGRIARRVVPAGIIHDYYREAA